MKLVVALILFLFTNVLPQEVPKAIQVDEMGEVCSEDLMARMDNFLIQLANNPASKGVVVYHGRTDTEGRNTKLLSYFSVYPARKGLSESYLKIIRGANRDEQIIQFWLIPAGASEPKPKAFAPVDFEKATLFDRAPADFHRWDSKLDIYDDGFWDLGCNFSPNRGMVAKIVKERKNLGVFLIVYTAGNAPSKGLRTASFALNDLVKNFAVPRNRVRAIYGGARKKPEIEFWLVPKGGQRPNARPNLPPIRTF